MASLGGCGTAAWIPLKRNVKNESKKKKKGFINVTCSGSSVLTDPYKTLRINPTASESDVRKAFRHLALQYHPDVCRGSNCDVQFHQINEAYDIVMSNLRGGSEREMCTTAQEYEYDPDEAFRGMNDPDWDMWEEWMGWEGAGIRDYTSHINPYI